MLFRCIVVSVHCCVGAVACYTMSCWFPLSGSVYYVSSDVGFVGNAVMHYVMHFYPLFPWALAAVLPFPNRVAFPG